MKAEKVIWRKLEGVDATPATDLGHSRVNKHRV